MENIYLQFDGMVYQQIVGDSYGHKLSSTIRMSLYIFLINNIYYLCCTCIDFYDFFAWGGCWFVVYIRRFTYKFLNVCPFDYTAIVGVGRLGP